MRLVYLTDAGASGTRLGAFLEAVMRGFKPDKFIMIIGRLERNLAYLYKWKRLDERRRKWAVTHLKELRRAALRCGLTTTAAAALSSIEFLTTPNLATDRPVSVRVQMESIVSTMRRLVTWEMEQLVYFDLPAHQMGFWNDSKEPFGEEVSKAFTEDDVRRNLEEASKCLALDRGSACVFHLMCAIDRSLQRYCRKIKVRYRATWDWKEILRRIFERVNKFSQKTRRQLHKKEQHLSCYTHLNAVRAAWRNPTMHSRRIYTTEEALDIFNATGGFMRDLAKVI